MPKKPKTPSVHPAIVHAAAVLVGEVRYFTFEKGCGTHYIVVPLGQGEKASVSLGGPHEWIVNWPFGSIERRRFVCPNLTEVVKLLAELSVTPLPEKEIPNDRR